MNEEQRVNYLRAIFQACASEMPSCADYDLAAKWADQEIPLAVVLQGISQVKQPKSVRYVKAAVEEEMRRWRRALA